jgi:hypothetical protein
MTIVKRTFWSTAAACALALVLLSCSGGGGGGTGGSTPPPPAPPSTNPCAGIGLDAPAGVLREATPAELAKREPRICLREPLNVLGEIWKHRAPRDRGTAGTAGRSSASADVGEIAVIQDDGDIMIPANAFDLKAAGLTFVRNASGGYDVRSGDATFRQTLGQRVPLSDDQSASFAIPFSATFFGAAYTSAFVNSDGNVTFQSADSASTERSVTRFLTGPPRVSLYFADLDPSAGGGIFVNPQPDFFTVTWCNVPGFEDSRKMTAQLVVQRDGQVDFKFADTTTLVDAVVGLSPGATNVFSAVDLARSSSGTIEGGAGAVGERFAAAADIDLAALGQKFYRTHDDVFDQLVIWSDRKLVTDAFAYEITVSNQIRGLGVGTFDVSREFGSGGALGSVVFMDEIGKYPDDPAVKFVGENSTLGLLGHESGHRWLVSLKFLDPTGKSSGAWLGRDEVHWSFFMDSDASFVEGNDIEDLGGGSFRTAAAVERYSALDQYAMGLRSTAEVPPVFYVENPANVGGNRTKDSSPRVGVTFSGTRRSVLIQDVVDALGPRNPDEAASPKLHRQAFIYVVGNGSPADAATVAKIDRFRREWEPYFQAATDGRMRVETRLNR